MRCPVISTYLSLSHLPRFALRQGRVCCSSPPFVSHCRYWDKEVLRAERDSRKPSLTKAIIKCYWKSYLVLGIFTLIEVKTFTYSELFFQYMWIASEMDWTAGERGKRFKA